MSWEDKDIDCPYEYALASFVGPRMPQKADIPGIKIRGVGTMEECRARAKKLQEHDNDRGAAVDTYVVEFGRWLPLEFTTVDARKAGMTQEFQDARMQEFFDSLASSRRRQDAEMAQRKADLMAGRIPKDELERDLVAMQKERISLDERIVKVQELIAEAEKREELIVH